MGYKSDSAVVLLDACHGLLGMGSISVLHAPHARLFTCIHAQKASRVATSFNVADFSKPMSTAGMSIADVKVSCRVMYTRDVYTQGAEIICLAMFSFIEGWPLCCDSCMRLLACLPCFLRCCRLPYWRRVQHGNMIQVVLCVALMSHNVANHVLATTHDSQLTRDEMSKYIDLGPYLNPSCYVVQVCAADEPVGLFMLVCNQGIANATLWQLCTRTLCCCYTQLVAG